MHVFTLCGDRLEKANNFEYLEIMSTTGGGVGGGAHVTNFEVQCSFLELVTFMILS